MKQAQRVLFITPQAPASGGNACSMKSLEALALFSQHYPVTLACPARSDREPQALKDTLGLEGIIWAKPDAAVQADEVAQRLNAMIAPDTTNRFSEALARQVTNVAADFDIIVIDHFYAFFYQPAEFTGTTIYHAHAAHFADIQAQPDCAGLEEKVVNGLRKRELDACAGVDHVFATANDALRLADAGVPFGKLQSSLLGSHIDTRKSDAIDFNRTKAQLLYVGYLGDADNVRSLMWFIREVLPQLRESMPRLPLHLVGKDPDLQLLTLGMSDPNIHFHRSMEEAEMAGESFRVSIDPLLYERVVDTKLINNLARGTPTVTTVAGVARLRGEAPDTVVAAQSSGDMAAHIRTLLTDKSAWRKLAVANREFARSRLHVHDLMYRLRAQLSQQGAVGAA
ncbi:glycosyltransferase [Halioglobus pacificus]|uniref:Uncharacterized protein n=1 Tax=Parahalioglobus pacificus TaxID=930806 RepID=A0A919CJQ2_9GAMM|nr:glycosyltransferase [Halioglobus pacificus]GHD31097.1 hypothetical protein GCM10007053_13780 [Halioglobus pacificus]